MELMSYVLPTTAGRLLGCHITTVRLLLLRGALRGIETPYGWLIEPQSLRELIEARQAQGQQWHANGYSNRAAV